jgi:hypothetical protein
MRMSWEPANEAEAAMAAALGRGDTTGFFRAVLMSPLYLPAVRAELVEEHARTLFSIQVQGTSYLLVFTSPAAAAQVDGADTVVVTDYRALLESWPDPSWRLALNPGAPIDALVPPDVVVRAALEEVTVPLAEQVPGLLGQPARSGDAVPANRVEAGIAVALADDDPDLLLDVLVTAAVLVPTAVPVEPAALAGPEFPWRRVEDTVALFTSPERLADALPASVPTVTADLVDVVAVWPPRTWLVLNPGTPFEVRVAPERVPGLRDWVGAVVERYDLADAGRDADGDPTPPER